MASYVTNNSRSRSNSSDSDSDLDEDEEEPTHRICMDCYDANVHQDFTKQRIVSGMDNLNDWELICTIANRNNGDFYEVYCNLNKSSPLYKQFAICDSSNTGDYFDGDRLFISKYASLEEIVGMYGV